MDPLIQEITKEQLRTDIPDFRPGDSVRVHVKVVEGSRERIQVFDGVVIKRRGAGISETYTVRKVSSGVGVERTFPLHTPRVDKIEVTRHGFVRRAKLYYLRTVTVKLHVFQKDAESKTLDDLLQSKLAKTLVYQGFFCLPILKKKQKVVVFVLNFPELSHFDYLGSQNRAKKR